MNFENVRIEITDASVMFLCIALVVVCIIICDTVERIKNKP
ncbi:hypothetical protein SAMN05421866_0009 [Chryseobacterium oranimense]|uniref:Uncharacterized protein n=1 Tax=Chryseobacterium oranimense TaxID=421058 RepID=A0A1M5X8I5_9FLAO|nr:hypothetical protein SAMN05421866_0009 [Chryseobacterium oranimense]